MEPRKYFRLMFMLMMSAGFLSQIQAQDLTGEQVLDKIKESINATSSQIHIAMEIYNKSGDKRERALDIYTKDKDNVSNALIKFTAPADVAGTAFLSRDVTGGNDEMYLYMPVLGGVRKIAGSQKNGSFVGTDFTYNDLSILGGGNFKDDYTATVIRHSDEEYVLKLDPTNEDIHYQYVKMWVEATKWFPTKMELYDPDGSVEKELTNSDLVKIDNLWTAKQLTMKNVQKGTKTVLSLENIQYNVTLNDQIFTTRYMQR